MTELDAFHTHLYPGARGRITAPADGPAQVRFSDGTRVPARLAGDLLTLAAHRTAAGTKIPERRWRIATEGDGFRVTARA